MRRIKVLALILAIAFVSTAVTGCGSNTSTGTASQSTASATAQASQSDNSQASSEPKTITIWSYMDKDNEIPIIRQYAEEWAKQTGNNIKIVSDFGNDKFAVYVQAAKSKNGPDLVFGVPHDNLGTFNRGKLLQEVPEGTINTDDYIETALNAVKYDGKMYAIPLSIDTSALYYNTDKVKNPPKTYEEFISLAKEVGFMTNITNLYSAYPFVVCNGGYIFKSNNGTLDPNDIGLGNEGAIKSYDLIKSLVVDYKLMKPDVSGDIAKANFQNGKIGLYISGTWDMPAFDKAKTKYAVATLPTYNGKVMPTFVGIQAAFVNPFSEDQKESWDLMKYLVAKTPIPLLKKTGRIPVTKEGMAQPEITENKNIAAFAEQAKYGDPMPNIPEMNTVWGPAGNNLKLIVQGKISSAKAAEEMVKQIKDGIQKMGK